MLLRVRPFSLFSVTYQTIAEQAWAKNGKIIISMPKPSLFKKPIETGHTFASISIVRKQLLKLLRAVNIIVQILVLPYYAYLIGKNYADPFYVSVYGTLVGASLLFMLLEQLFLRRQNAAEDKAERRKAKKRRQINRLVFKSVKYAIRLLILTMAYIQIALGTREALFVATTILSSLLILGQLLLDVFIMFVLKYFEYIRLGFAADLKSSPIFNMGNSDQAAARRLESQAEEMGVFDLTSSEVSKLEEIKAEMALNEQESQKEAKASIRHSSILIRKKRFVDAVADPALQERIEKRYSKKKAAAADILNDANRCAALFEKMRRKLEKAPEGLAGLQAFPQLLAWAEEGQGAISEQAKTEILAATLYCLDPFSLISSFRGEIAYADDEYVINKCIDAVEEEYQQHANKK